MIASIKRGLTWLYRKLTAVRRTIFRIERNLPLLAAREQVDSFRAELQRELSALTSLVRKIDIRTQPLERLDEIERRICQHQDEHILGQEAMLVELRSVTTMAKSFEEQLQPLGRLDEIERRIFHRQDEHILGQEAMLVELRSVTTMAKSFEEQLQPLGRLDEVERRILQRQDEHFLARDELAPATGLLEKHFDKLQQVEASIKASEASILRGLTSLIDDRQGGMTQQLANLSSRMNEALSLWKEAKQGFDSDMRLHDRQLRMALSLQEQLVAGQASHAGPREIPQLRQIMSDKDASAAQALIEEKYVEFLDQKVYFDDLISLYVVFKEIFLYEDYFVDLGTPTPRVIDAGAHIGLATIYLKNIYPEAQITCFEPDPRNFELLERNTRNFGSSVVRIQKAVTSDGQDVRLLRRQGMSMASTIYERSSQISGLDQITAEAIKLSPFLMEPIDLLKMDIEGPEDLVLEESRDLIKNVHYIFIEFHTGKKLPLSRLKAMLDVLDRAGFIYQIERAREYQARMMHRPFTHLDTDCTHVIHAKNMSWSVIPNSIQ